MRREDPTLEIQGEGTFAEENFELREKDTN
jgi:hypothetical protein